MFTSCLLLMFVSGTGPDDAAQALPALRPAESRATPAPSAPSTQDKQVGVQIRIISFQDALLRWVWKDRHLANQPGWPQLQQVLNAPGDNRAHPATLLTEPDLHRLLETLYSDRWTTVTSLPELTFASGQNVALRLPPEDHGFYGEITANFGPGVRVVRAPEAEKREPGVTFGVQPTIVADGKHIRLHFQMSNIRRTHAREVENVQWTDHQTRVASVLITTENHEPLYETIRVDDTWQIPAGHSLVLSGWTTMHKEQRESEPVPVLNSLPGCEHLFRSTTTATDRERVLIIVTPRGISN